MWAGWASYARWAGWPTTCTSSWPRRNLGADGHHTRMRVGQGYTDCGAWIRCKRSAARSSVRSGGHARRIRGARHARWREGFTACESDEARHDNVARRARIFDDLDATRAVRERATPSESDADGAACCATCCLLRESARDAYSISTSRRFDILSVYCLLPRFDRVCCATFGHTHAPHRTRCMAPLVAFVLS